MGSRTADAPLPTAARAQVETIRDIPLAVYSRFVQRIRRRYGAELALLPPGVPDRGTET